MPSLEAIRPLVLRAWARLRASLDGILPPALRTLSARVPVRGAGRTGTSSATLPGLDTRPAPMRPVRPPAATNDNPLEGVHEAVERALRARGHLR